MYFNTNISMFSSLLWIQGNHGDLSSWQCTDGTTEACENCLSIHSNMYVNLNALNSRLKWNTWVSVKKLGSLFKAIFHRLGSYTYNKFLLDVTFCMGIKNIFCFILHVCVPNIAHLILSQVLWKRFHSDENQTHDLCIIRADVLSLDQWASLGSRFKLW